MYQPEHFKVGEADAVRAFIRAHPLGMLITGGGGGLSANPLPMLLDTTPDGDVLRTHMARANEQWRDIGDGASVMVLFQGAEHYISPGWYATKIETGQVVPTWNYLVAEVHGVAKVMDDPAWIRRQVADLTASQERARPVPWAPDDAPAKFIDAQLRAIVGISIEVTAMAGKFKLSQNRPERDRRSVIAHLQDGDHKAADMAALIRSQKSGD
ncbi:FMN-binding negative transcriptional regulator [Roseiarcaceae bacterium H3SJ34-1]|uniref:FMN-binding negative transcriptional regulator n=1 Tax=Terripilifer ovatus TaxID=3032367 RepID=UPI003AB98DAD|nr:FMN-binding negative transcriptional regulator [Roseiarcaceae bacterium H3SJ34-1]